MLNVDMLSLNGLWKNNKMECFRKALVQQWESSVRVLHQRDEDINRVLEEIGNIKVLAKGRLKDLEEQKAFYETQCGNNKELEREITSSATESSQNKENLRILDENLRDLNGNVRRFYLRNVQTSKSSTNFRLNFSL